MESQIGVLNSGCVSIASTTFGSGVTPLITRSKEDADTPFCAALERMPAAQESKSAAAGAAADMTSAAIASDHPPPIRLSQGGRIGSETDLRAPRRAHAVPPALLVDVAAC